MTTTEAEPAEQESLQESAERQEKLWQEANGLLANGDPWKALPKKAEALGLKPVEGFTSMAKQQKSELMKLGAPLSFDVAGNTAVKAAAELFPDNGDPAVLVEDLQKTAAMTNNGGNMTQIEQAAKGLDDVNKRAREIQYQNAFDQVGTYSFNSGYLSARAGNGDLLVASDSPETRLRLENAGYKEAQGDALPVPFNNDAASKEGVNWTEGTGFDSPTS